MFPRAGGELKDRTLATGAALGDLQIEGHAFAIALARDLAIHQDWFPVSGILEVTCPVPSKCASISSSVFPFVSGNNKAAVMK